MKRLLVVALAALQGACGLLLLPLPGEPWILAEDEQTGTQTSLAPEPEREPERERTPVVEPSVEPVPQEQPAPAPKVWTGQTVVRAEYVEGLAGTERGVYWTDGRAVRGAGLEGGAGWEVGRFPDADTEWPDTYRIAAGSGFVYAARQNARQILRADERGGGFVVVCQTQGTPGLIAVGGGAVWWTEDEQSLWRMEPGQAPEQVWTGEDGPVRLAVVGSRAYWLGRGLTSVWSWESGQVVSHALPEGYGHALAADAQGFYVLMRPTSGTEVWSCRDQTCTRLARTDEAAPEALAVGPTHVYWAGTDRLWRADKQGRGAGRVSDGSALGPVWAGERAFYWVAYTSTAYTVEARPY